MAVPLCGDDFVTNISMVSHHIDTLNCKLISYITYTSCKYHNTTYQITRIHISYDFKQFSEMNFPFPCDLFKYSTRYEFSIRLLSDIRYFAYY